MTLVISCKGSQGYFKYSLFIQVTTIYFSSVMIQRIKFRKACDYLANAENLLKLKIQL